MKDTRWIEFELTASDAPGMVSVRIGAFGDRHVATVACGQRTTNGLGATAREALIAALSPFGSRATAAIMAAPAMFAASVQLHGVRPAS